MKYLTLIIFLMIVGCSNNDVASNPQEQTLFSYKNHRSFVGPEKWFTGNVKVDLLFPPNKIAHYSGAYVTFDAGARTAWHQHPAGQHMIVISGTALTGTRDGKIIKFSEGDTVWCPVGVDHWHGATAKAPMKHLVITGSKERKAVIWKEKVSDDQYHGKME